MNETDPFSVFGADDDEDEVRVHRDPRNTKEPSTIPNSVAPTTIVANTASQVDEKLSQIPKSFPGASVVPLDSRRDISTTTMPPKKHLMVDQPPENFVIPWPEQQNNGKQLLLYRSSQIRLVQSLNQFGGSRGYISTETISPGTLVLLEQPVVSWSDDDSVNSSNENDKLLHILYHHILKNPSLSSIQIQQILYDLENFHPVKDVVDRCCVGGRISPLESSSSTSSPQQLSNETIEQVYNMIQELHLQYSTVDDDTHRNNNDADNSKENYCNSHDPILLPSTTDNTTLFQRVRNCIMIQQHYTNRDTTPISEIDIYRIILALRYNALQSGLYYHSAMLNHSDMCNCVKFIPKPTNSKNTMTNRSIRREESLSNSQYSYPEIRTTRTIYPGEPLTISYIPNILSHASRRQYLWHQHRFDIGKNIIPHHDDDDQYVLLRKMECIHNEFPILANMDDYKATVTFNIETALAELDVMYHDMEHLLLQSKVNTNYKKNETDLDLFRQVQELEQASLELCISSEEELLQNPIHILLLPCRRLHVDICCMMLRQQQYLSSLLTSVERRKLLSRLVHSAYHLRHLQIILYGPDHFDIARTNLDLVHAIEELLSQSPKHLLNLSKATANVDDIKQGLMRLHTMTQWSTFEDTLRKDYERVKALYPDNANEYINR